MGAVAGKCRGIVEVLGLVLFEVGFGYLPPPFYPQSTFHLLR